MQLWKKMTVGGLYTELFCAVIPTLFSYILLFCYPYFFITFYSLAFQHLCSIELNLCQDNAKTLGQCMDYNARIYEKDLLSNAVMMLQG